MNWPLSQLVFKMHFLMGCFKSWGISKMQNSKWRKGCLCLVLHTRAVTVLGAGRAGVGCVSECEPHGGLGGSPVLGNPPCTPPLSTLLPAGWARRAHWDVHLQRQLRPAFLGVLSEPLLPFVSLLNSRAWVETNPSLSL